MNSLQMISFSRLTVKHDTRLQGYVIAIIECKNKKKLVQLDSLKRTCRTQTKIVLLAVPVYNFEKIIISNFIHVHKTF